MKRLLGELEVKNEKTLKKITEELEGLVSAIAADEDQIDAVVCTTEETPYLDAQIINEWIRKAMVRIGHANAHKCVIGVTLDNTKGKNSVQIRASKRQEV